MLLEDALRMRTQYLTIAHREESEEPQAQTYHNLVL